MEIIMKTKFMPIILVLLILANFISVSAMTTETFSNHIPMQDGLTEYRISNGERYSQWASYLEKNIICSSLNPMKLLEHGIIVCGSVLPQKKPHAGKL